ncbi:MAG: glycosyltransferase family 4 protein [Phyllobacteriaceae bacterium]|nr:glycosyltransferase family 4 protein [Phyllobacteriaceae bacterium]
MAYYFHRTRLDISYILRREAAFRRYNTTIEGWKGARFGPVNASRPIATAKMDDAAREGDKIVLLDAVWSPYRLDALAQYRRKGLKVFAFIYDMIPAMMPILAENNIGFFFHDWLLKSRERVEHFIAIPASCRADYLKFFGEQGDASSVCVLPLAKTRLETAGAVAKSSAATGVSASRFPALHEIAEVSQPVREAAFAPFVLCVGTIEGRKNGWRLLVAWKSIIDAGLADLPRLVFVGRPGWCSSALRDFLEGTGNLYGYVTMLDSPSDEDLAFLYRRCQFLAMPSLYEGWGLPVGEALSYGKTAVVANVSSLPEVGGDLVEYCDPDSIASIRAAVMRLVFEPGRREELEARIAKAELRDWDDVARDLLNILN